MTKHPRPQGQELAVWLGESAREVLAAWFVLFVIVAAGLSFLTVHGYDEVDSQLMLTMPGAHHRLAADDDWDDAACAAGRCGNSQSAQEIGLDSTPAAQREGDTATPVHSGSSSPDLPQANRGDQREDLC